MTAYQFGSLVGLALCSIAGYRMCERKGQDPWLGGALGFFLGLIGLLVVATFRDRSTPIASPQQAYVQPPSGPMFPVQPSGQRYVAPIAPQYAAPQPPVQPVQQTQLQPPAGP